MGGSDVSYPQQQIPAYQIAIGNEAARFMQAHRDGFAASPYDLSYVSPTQRAAWGQAQQFGASGLQPYMSMLAGMAQNGGVAGAEDALRGVAERDFNQRAMDLRSQAATTGLSSSSGLQRALAQEQGNINVDLAKQLVGVRENAMNRQLQAAQLGLTGIPSALTQLSAIGEQETSPFLRQYQDWLYRNIQAPLSMYSGQNVMANPGQPEPVVQQKTNWLSQMLGLAGQLGAAYLLS